MFFYYSSIILLFVVFYTSLFIYRGVNLSYLLVAITLVGITSYNILKHQKNKYDRTYKSIRPLYTSIIIFIIYTRYLPKFTYAQAYERIERELSKKYSSINLVQNLGNFTRSYPYNLFSNNTYIYTIKADDEKKYYFFNQYTGEYYEIEEIDGALYTKFSK